MALPAGLIPAIGSTIGGALSFIDNNKARKETAKQNQADRDFQLDMWNKTNEYNSPLQEMQRLKAGGLNPNLVYGGGATTKAQNMTPTASKPLPTPNAGQVFDSVLNNTIDLQLKETQKDVMQMEIFNKAQNINESETRRQLLEDESPYRLSSTVTKSAFDTAKYGQFTDLNNTTIDGMKQLLEKTKLQNAEQAIKNSFLKEKEQQALYEAYARVKSIKATTRNVDVETLLKQEQLNLRKRGIEINDNIWTRVFSDLLPTKSTIGNAGRSIYQYGKKMYNNYKNKK